MPASAQQDAARSFDLLRPRPTGVAYRMLGSVAEDVVQDAFLRWLDTDRAAVREPEAFLRRIVTHTIRPRVVSSPAGRARTCVRNGRGFGSP